MNIRTWFAPGRPVSLLVGLAICSLLLAQGVRDEIALGGISGRATMKENGKVLAGAQITIRPIDYEASGARDRVLLTDKKGEFSLRHLQEGAYTIEASTTAHRLHPTLVTVQGGQKCDVELEMAPIEPYLDVTASQKVFTPAEPASVELHGFVPDAALDVALYKLDFDKLLSKGGMQEALGPLARRYEGTPDDPATLGAKALTFGRKLENRDAEGVFIERVTLDPLPEGVYWIQCKVGGLVKGTYLNITKAALVTKSVGKDVTCYVTEIDTGKPIAGAKVGYGTKNGFVQTGVTDARGLSQMTLPADQSHASVMAVSGASKALADFYVYGVDPTNARIFTYTDRPVYRPGDQVQFKGIVRLLEGDEYRVPKVGQVAVEIRDPDDSLLESMTLPTNAMGTFNGRFSVNKESAPGGYQLIVRYGELKETHYVSFAAYRKPDFTVKVEPGAPFYVRGDKAKAVVKCEYYFGGPVVGAEVSVYIDRQPYWSWMGSDEDGEYGDEEYYGDYGGGEGYDEIKATTDEKGEAVIEFDTELPDDPKEAEQDFTYNISASVTDPSGKYFDGKGTIKVVRGDVDLALVLDTYMVSPGEKARFTIKAKNQKDQSPAAGLRVALTSETEVWTGREEASLDAKTQEVVLGPDGTAEVEIAPARPGSLKLTAKADNVVERAWVYVEGTGGGFSGPKPPKLSIQLDKRRYKIGDTAKAMIQTDSPGGSVLLALEGEKLYSTQVVELKGNVTTVNLPVTRDLAPNAYVAVAYVKDKKFSEATKRLVVELGERKLDVTVTSDRTVYQPGDVAQYTVHTNADGKGTPAEVSLAIVDESIYAIQEDDTKIVEGFFPKRENRVNTSYSFPELYLDGGDKAPASVRVRTNFKDTAFWNPTVMTDANGEAVVDVKLPDNLTQWRATAVAVSAQTQVGIGTEKVRSRKSLMVRLSAPAFMVQQDRQQLVAMITNDTGSDAEVHVELTAQGASLDGDLRQSLRIRNGSQESLTWNVDARTSGTASFVAKVWTDANTSDGVELRVPINAHGRVVQGQESGDLRAGASFSMTLFEGADPKLGRLRISLIPSISSALTDSLDELIGFPYGCVEQTMSRFMPTVVVSRALKDLNLPAPKQAAQIPAMVKDGFTRLKTMQHNDGGWGWWENDASDLHMTCYVLEGYALAAQAGYSPNAFSLESGLRWAKARAKEAAKLDKQEIPYLAYVLALHGQKDDAVAALGSAKFAISKATPTEAALALMAYSRLGAAYGSQAGACLDRLLSQAKGSGSIRYWEEGYWGVESTARCLQAVASVSPEHPILAQVARYLMISRRGSMWTSTRDTAYAIIGLSRVIKALPPPKPGSVVTIKVNGREAAKINLTPEALARPGIKVDVPIESLASGPNKIELIQTGPGGGAPGTLYYTADLTQTVVRQQLGEVLSDGGIRVQRAYYKMESRRLEDDTLKLLPSKKPVREVSPGDVIQCVLTIKSDGPREFMMVEDPIPAGFRVTERATTEYDWEWSYWYCSIVVRDDRVAFFARFLEKGDNQITYMLRAETPGLSHALPTTVSNMYDPMNRASCGEDLLEIRE